MMSMFRHALYRTRAEAASVLVLLVSASVRATVDRTQSVTADAPEPSEAAGHGAHT
jgi:hypothetical protein